MTKRKIPFSIEFALERLNHLTPRERAEWIDAIRKHTEKHRADVWRAARALRPSAVSMLRLYG